jgi:chromosome segregation ATPase
VKVRALQAADVDLGKAGGLVGVGMVLLKLAQMGLRAMSKGKADRLTELDRVLAAQEKFNANLQRDNDALREREDDLEKRIDHLEDDNRSLRVRIEALEREKAQLQEDRDEAISELRLWKRGLRSPGTTPREP